MSTQILPVPVSASAELCGRSRATAEEIDLAYVQAHVVLFDPDRLYEEDEGLIRAHAIRVVPHAGNDGRALVLWSKADGGRAWSELNGELLKIPERSVYTPPLYPVM